MPKSKKFKQYKLPEIAEVDPREDILTQVANGSLPQKLVVDGDAIESPNFTSGESGYRLDKEGNLEANSGTFRGSLQAGSVHIPDQNTTSNSFHVDTDGDTWWGATETDFDADNDNATAYILKDGTAKFQNVTVDGYVLTTKGAFGGDGSDGALSITSGTTTLDMSGARVYIRNYTSISITGSGELAFSNPHANGTVIILRSQGNVTLTSSAAPMINAAGMGAAGGAAVSRTTVGFTDGNDGNEGIGFTLYKTDFGSGGEDNAGGDGGGVIVSDYHTTPYHQMIARYPNIYIGAGGGSGAAHMQAIGGTITSGAGGNGGGALLIECGGGWNFTTASGISVAGSDGGDASRPGASQAAATGGGGGGAGFCLVFYNTLTSNAGTITTSGGTGGNTATIGGLGAVPRGGGGGGTETAGTIGTNSGTDGTKSGGDGADGFSNVDENVEFA